MSSLISFLYCIDANAIALCVCDTIDHLYNHVHGKILVTVEPEEKSSDSSPYSGVKLRR